MVREVVDVVTADCVEFVKYFGGELRLSLICLATLK